MIKVNREKLLPTGIFVLYILAASAVIVGWHLIFPGEIPPLPVFSTTWRLLRGMAEAVRLFPALALSALVIPFGMLPAQREKFSAFSPKFLSNLSSSIFCAIGAAVAYGILCLLALPLILNHQVDLESRGLLYRLSMEQAKSHAGQNEWMETNRFLSVCERIWPLGPDIGALRTETNSRLEAVPDITATLNPSVPPARQDLTVPRPVSAFEAITLAETAMKEGRYFDAHWLATLGQDLAPEGSVEEHNAARLASLAWNTVASLEPNSRESEAYSIYHLKRDAYAALVSRDWIQAYYLFRELLSLTPQDPDGLYYIDISRQGLERMAFFMDKMVLRESPRGALFSLPVFFEDSRSSRMVLRFSSLSLLPDSAYGIGLEAMSFDTEGRLLWRMNAPYARIMPLSLEEGPHVSILMRALDSEDKNLRWEPETESVEEAAPSNAQLLLTITWDDFVLLAGVHDGANSYGPAELLAASRLGSGYGYIPLIFEAELIRMFAEPAVFLPLLVFVIALGWRYRALKKNRYTWIPMLGIFPLGFNGFFHLFAGCLKELAVWAVVCFGFAAAVFVFCAGFLVLFFLSLVTLAAQRG